MASIQPVDNEDIIEVASAWVPSTPVPVVATATTISKKRDRPLGSKDTKPRAQDVGLNEY